MLSFLYKKYSKTLRSITLQGSVGAAYLRFEFARENPPDLERFIRVLPRMEKAAGLTGAFGSPRLERQYIFLPLLGEEGLITFDIYEDVVFVTTRDLPSANRWGHFAEQSFTRGGLRPECMSVGWDEPNPTRETFDL